MITINKVPNKVVLAGQTIPFIVTTDLFDEQGSFDAIERSFKYLFEVKTLNDNGDYVTYSTVAIPPRPDTLAGFFDAAPLVKSAITFDNATHLNEDASPMPNSIVRFLVLCTERYLDENNDFVNGQTLNLGEYVAIDGAVTEGVAPYLIKDDSVNVPPMHHHELLGDQLVVRPKEPLTLSFIAEPTISNNLFNFTHGDFGSFDYGTVTQYTNISVNSGSMSKTTNGALSGAALRQQIPPSFFVTSDTEGNLFHFDNIPLENDQTYVFKIYAKLIGSVFNLPSNSSTYYSFATGFGIDTSTQTTISKIRDSALRYVEIAITFTTNDQINGSEYIEIGLISEISNDLIKLNKRSIIFDSASLFKVETNALPNDARIVVDKGLPTEITYGLSTMMDPIKTYETISQFRFDVCVGTNFLAYDGPDQDNETGFFFNNNLKPGKYYQIELFNSSNPSVTMAKSEKIYQMLDCNRYNGVRLKFLNQLGAWDYYTFDKVSVATKRVEKDIYKITSGKIDKVGDNFDYNENVASMGYKTLNITEDDFIIINSDWVKNETGKFLKNIINSKQVYILNPELYMDVPDNQAKEYPVIVQDAEFEYRNNSVDAKLTNATFTLKLALPFKNKTTNA